MIRKASDERKMMWLAIECWMLDLGSSAFNVFERCLLSCIGEKTSTRIQDETFPFLFSSSRLFIGFLDMRLYRSSAHPSHDSCKGRSVLPQDIFPTLEFSSFLWQRGFSNPKRGCQRKWIQDPVSEGNGWPAISSSWWLERRWVNHHAF